MEFSGFILFQKLIQKNGYPVGIRRKLSVDDPITDISSIRIVYNKNPVDAGYHAI